MPLYHPSMYDSTQTAASCWQDMLGPYAGHATPLRGDCHVDVAVLGGGFTGLSAALHLARDHSLKVCVLEAAEPGWGASGRNGGFCCLYPSKLSVAQLAGRYGEDATRAFLHSQMEGIELVRDLASTESIPIQMQGDGIYEVAHASGRFAELEAQARELKNRFGVPARSISREEFAATVHDSSEQFGALHVQTGFGLNPLALARGLAEAAARHGARIHPNSEVIDLRREGERYRLITGNGSVSCDRLIIATNGYTPETLLPPLQGRSVPVISNIISTRPLSESELQAQNWRTESPCSNTRQLLFYYRLLPDRRLLFGARGDTTGSPQDGERMRAWMTRRLGEVFPAWREVPVTHYWRGFVCMSADGTPAVGTLDDESRVFYGMSYHGSGVASAPWTGRLLARLAAGTAKQEDIPLVMRGPGPRLPLPGLRLWYLRAALAWFRWKDRR